MESQRNLDMELVCASAPEPGKHVLNLLNPLNFLNLLNPIICANLCNFTDIKGLGEWIGSGTGWKSPSCRLLPADHLKSLPYNTHTIVWPVYGRRMGGVWTTRWQGGLMWYIETWEIKRWLTGRYGCLLCHIVPSLKLQFYHPHFTSSDRSCFLLTPFVIVDLEPGKQ